jgi:hypothetical protein
MKKIIIPTLFFFIGYNLSAQAPQGVNYQAVARSANGFILPSQNIGIKFTILDTSIIGPVIYQETHSTITNFVGLFTVVIGKGTPVSGTFPAINWANGKDKFLKVEIAPMGGTNYLLQGITQLWSVPFALYAEKTKLIAGAGINITNGNTISATGTPSYNAGTGINITGTTISHALQAGTGINITGATISHNLVAGAGINISGNVISSTGSGSNYWLSHANGIYYDAGRVGIGTTPDAIIPLSVYMPNTGSGNAVALFNSNDTWHSGLALRNNNVQYTMVVGGPNNIESRYKNFGLFNGNTATWSLIVEGTSNNIGIGSLNGYSTPAKSRLHVFGGDINIDQINSGIIMKSPNGACWRVTIDNSGNLVRTAITCP